MTGHIVVQGVQGHIAYPHLADNPVHRLAHMMAALRKAMPQRLKSQTAPLAHSRPNPGTAKAAKTARRTGRPALVADSVDVVRSVLRSEDTIATVCTRAWRATPVGIGG